MTFAHPLALLWGLLAVPLVIFYWRKIPLRREVVATNLIWQQVFGEERLRESWQRWRHGVSLAVQLLVLTLLVLALAEPQIPPPRQIAMILDNSDSMNAANAESTRLGQAKEVARRLVEGLRPCDSAAVLSAGDAVGVRCTLTGNQETLCEAIDSIEATQGTTNIAAAMELVRRLLDDEQNGSVRVITDTCFPEAAIWATVVGVEVIRVGKAAENLAITRSAARRNVNDPQTCQVFVEVRNFSDEAAEGTVVLRLEGQPVASEPVTVAGNGWSHRVFTAAVPQSGRFQVHLEHDDAHTGDNEVSVEVPAPTESRFGPVPEVEVLLDQAARAKENDLRPTPSIGTAAAEVPAARPGVPPWAYLVGLGVLLSVAQWCFYQRRWMS